MSTMWLYVIVYAMEMLILFFGDRWKPEFLVGFSLVNLIITSMFGGGLISVFGADINITSITYSFVLISLAIYYYHYGMKQSMNFVRSTSALTLLCVFGGSVLTNFNFESIEFNNAINVIFDNSYRIMSGSLIAYIFAGYILLHILEKAKLYGIYLSFAIAVFFAQFVDSIIFFGIAFFGNVVSIISTILVGFVVKYIISILALPIFIVAKKDENPRVSSINA